MSRSETDLYYSKNIICFKWYSNKPALLLATNVDGMSGVYKVMRQTEGSATKTTVSSLDIKLYIIGMGGVDITDKKQLVTDSIIKASIAFT